SWSAVMIFPRARPGLLPAWTIVLHRALLLALRLRVAAPDGALRKDSFRAHRTDAADPGIPTAVPDRPLRFAGFRDRHRPERHGRGCGDALSSFQPRGGARGRDRRRRHPYALPRPPTPCRAERHIQRPTQHDSPAPP